VAWLFWLQTSASKGTHPWWRVQHCWSMHKHVRSPSRTGRLRF